VTDRRRRQPAFHPDPRTLANIPTDLRYTQEHEYVRSTADSSIVEIGITDYAQGELGDIVYVELPSVGSKYSKHDVFGTIEAVKAVSELFCPLSGEVTEINQRLDKEPALVNTDPYGAGWMIRLRASKPEEKSELLDSERYNKLIRA
jgi:glycine cleavage system H protein